MGEGRYTHVLWAAAAEVAMKELRHFVGIFIQVKLVESEDV